MQKSVVFLAGVSLLVASLAAGAAGRDCRYSAPRNAELDAAGLKLLTVDLGPNELVIQGDPGIKSITVRGTACASDQKWLGDLKVATARHGDDATVTASNGGHNIVLGLFGGSYAYLKLDVRVPQSLAVKLLEGSGDADARDLAALDATLGSGDLKVTGIAGAFGLRVGSGDVVATNVGSLALSSVGSGDASVDGVHADARVDGVGSGDLALRNVKGRISVGSLSSGDVKVAGVGGGVTVGSVGSGDLGIRDAKGDVIVKTVASGDVQIVRVGGSVHLDSVGSGDLGVDGVDGDFSVGELGSGDVHHHGVKGRVSIPRTDD